MRILVVEDEPSLCQSLKELLQGKGYQVEIAHGVSEAQEKIRRAKQTGQQFSLYLLDVVLGKESGYTLCASIREQEMTPILFLTAMDEEDQVIRGLDLGADDYVTKPFRSRELLSRMEANLRRFESLSAAGQEEARRMSRSGSLCSGALTFVPKQGQLFRGDQKLELRRGEMALLAYFMENDGILLRREQILERLWDQGGEFVEDNTLTVQVSRLRQKLGKCGSEEYIETIRGLGYRWRQPVQRQ